MEWVFNIAVPSPHPPMWVIAARILAAWVANRVPVPWLLRGYSLPQYLNNLIWIAFCALKGLGRGAKE